MARPVLKKKAATVPGKIARSQGAKFMKGLPKVNGDGKLVRDHINPLKGHPVDLPASLAKMRGKAAMFPTAGLSPALHSGRRNVQLLTQAAHQQKHIRNARLELWLGRAVNPAVTSLRGGYIGTSQSYDRYR